MNNFSGAIQNKKTLPEAESDHAGKELDRIFWRGRYQQPETMIEGNSKLLIRQGCTNY